MTPLQVDSSDVIQRVDGDVFFRFDPAKHPATRDGQPVTSTLIDTLADQAEQQGPPPGLIPGGKSLNKDGSHSPRIYLVVPNDVRDKIKQAAAKKNMSVSRWLRGVVEEKLAA